MEKRLKDYEKFINGKVDNPDEKLIEFHREMLRNFQHERTVHLFIMLFFILLTLGLTILYVLMMMSSRTYYFFEFLPMLVATILMWVLSICYVRHYYFLENHVQGLYDISRKLYENSSKKNGIDLKEVGKKIMKKVEKSFNRKEKK